MTSLRDVMVIDPIGIGADATMAEAAAVMARARIGSLMVDDGGGGVGILTERDVMRAAGGGGDLLETTVRDWMTVEPTTAPADQEIDAAAATMLAGGFRHLPVSDGTNLVGIVSMRSILSALIGGTQQQPGQPAGEDGDPAPTVSPARVQERRSRMFEAARRLQEHSASTVDDHDQWRAGLARTLDDLRDIVDAHITETEGPDGLFEELIRESDGRLSASVRRLGREHERISSLVGQLRAAVDAATDPASLRRAADQLFAQLEAHRHRGSDLLWRAYSAEIGVGD